MRCNGLLQLAIVSLVLCGAACGSSTGTGTLSTATPVEADAWRGAASGDGTPSRLELEELVGLLNDVDPADSAAEAAAIQMLAFRELIYLPFRYNQQAPIDGRGRGAGTLEALEAARLTFTDLGAAGLDVLTQCASEALEGRTGQVHLAGDDATLLGRACLEMLGSAYGSAALPVLVDLTRGPRHDAAGMLLQRFALDVIRELDGAATVPAGDNARWRAELGAWMGWFKGAEADRYANVPAASCDWRCVNAVLARWIDAAVEHSIPPQGSLPEPRLVTTLRAYLMVRASTVLPVLAEACKSALDRRLEGAALQAWLLFDLWADTARRQYPAYLRHIVIPTLLMAIDPSEIDRGLAAAAARPPEPAGAGWTWRRTLSSMAAAALERTLGVSPGDRACLTRSDAAQTRDCLVRQVEFWQRQLALPSWQL